MYKYMKRMMALADTIGEVAELFMGNWGDKHERISLEGRMENGKKFQVILEVEKDGN